MAEYSKAQQLRPKRKEKKVVEYDQATEAARDWEGVLHCARCGRSLHDRDAQRHHVKRRSQGGGHEAANLEIVCGPWASNCHDDEHMYRNKPA